MKEPTGEEREALLKIMREAAKMGKELGYQHRLDGRKFQLIRPDGTIALQCTAKSDEHYRELLSFCEVVQ